MEPTTQSQSESNSIIKEISILIALFIITMIILNIVFYNEKLTTSIWTVAAIFWILIIPGYCLTLLWKNSLLERVIIGIPASAAVIGTTSYYLGLTGINLKLQSWLLPAIIICATVLIYRLRTHKNNSFLTSNNEK